jgi:hypothetical protein
LSETTKNQWGHAKRHTTANTLLQEAIDIVKKELLPLAVEDRECMDGFILYFRGQLLLLLRKRGLLTEPQYKNGLKLL